MDSSYKLKDRSGRSALPLPLYYQIATSIRERIISGEWTTGQKLPTENILGQEYGASRQTIRKAKEYLIREGILRSVQGSGCYVNRVDLWASLPPSVDNLKEFFAFALKMSFKIHTYGMVANTPTVAARLRNEGENFVFQITGVRFQNDEPLSYVVYHLPREFAVQIPLEELDEKAFIPQFEQLAGIKATEGVQSIALGRADEQAAQHLNLKPGDPVLVVESIYLNDEGKPIEFVRTQYREALPYSIRMKR
ncbi:MAG: GntR family transcriptional regulator [Desulfarculaceae bacterium]